jgi:flagellar P-ring protein precursor FlgI
VQQIEASSVAELVTALNRLGADVRDIISILEALRDSGALHAEVIIL